VKNFVDLDFDFIGWAAIAEGKQRLLLLRKIIKDLKTRMEDKTLLRNIVPKLKMINFVEGKFGVEKYYDDVLRGKLGIAKKYEDRDVIKIEKVNGKNLHLTLSIVLNNTIKKSLRDFCQKLHTDCVAVGINAENGEVLFLSEVKKENLIESPKQRYFSLSYQGLYPPGSVFKPFVALMLLENHLIEKDTKTYCGGKIKYYNRIFNCWLGSGHGNIDVVSAIEHSCNIFFYNTIQKLNNQSIRSFVKKLKLGKKAKIDLPYEPLPKVTLAVNPLDKTLFSIGQSNVYLPLLKLAQVYSLFYNESYIPIVHLVKNIPKHKGKISIKVSKKNLEIVKSGLYKVVHSPSGTAYGIGLEKYKVYGKTGTVQVGKGLKPHSLFCGVWEGKIPISFCVLIEKVGSSKDYAVKFSATLLKILEEYFR
jgi:penicillin-binding protein 2